MPPWILIVEFATRLVLVLLLGLSVWSVAIIIDRWRFFSRHSPSNEADEARKLIAARKWDDLRGWAGSRPSLHAGLIVALLSIEERNAELIDYRFRSYVMERRP